MQIERNKPVETFQLTKEDNLFKQSFILEISGWINKKCVTFTFYLRNYWNLCVKGKQYPSVNMTLVFDELAYTFMFLFIDILYQQRGRLFLHVTITKSANQIRCSYTYIYIHTLYFNSNLQSSSN